MPRFNFKAGQNLLCRVIANEPGGYAVLVVNHNLDGFLPTKEVLQPGEELLCQFVCVSNRRILVTARFSKRQQIRIEHIPVCNSLKMKRATDLIMPPFDADSLKILRMDDHGIDWLVTDIEGSLKTGCVKSFSSSYRSRSAMLLYRGRVVGCIYNRKSMPDTKPTELSIVSMLSDLNLFDATAECYDLPEHIVLPMSSLFLGHPVQRNDQHNARNYLNYITGLFEKNSSTGCLVITLPASQSACLGFVHKGLFCGAFLVEDQLFRADKEFIYELVHDQEAKVEASVLPAQTTFSSAVPFGFSLGDFRAQNNGQ